MGAKRSLVVGAHIIDSGYDGEVFIDLHNIGTEEQYIATGDKIAQLVLVPVVHFRTVQTNGGLYDDSITISNRGEGALGSTDTAAGLCAPSPFSQNSEDDEEVLPHPFDGMPSGF